MLARSARHEAAIAGAIHDGNASSAAWYLRAAWPADFAPSSSTEAPAPIGGPYPELKMAEKIRGSDEAMKLLHDALAVSIAAWQRKRTEKPDEDVARELRGESTTTAES